VNRSQRRATRDIPITFMTTFDIFVMIRVTSGHDSKESQIV
jgi:hypothetical protein